MNGDERITCLILARGGSKRIVKKNLALVDGVSLLRRCLDTVTSVKGFNETWVSTDCAKIAEEASKVETVKVHLRSAHASTDTSSSLHAVQEFLGNHSGISTVALVQCTSPFLQKDHLEEACLKMKDPACDSVFAVKVDKSLRWTSKSGFLQPVNFDPSSRPRSQDLETEYVETGAFYFFRSYLPMNNLLQGPRSDVVVIPEELSLDIDTEHDLELARFLISSPRMRAFQLKTLEESLPAGTEEGK